MSLTKTVAVGAATLAALAGMTTASVSPALATGECAGPGVHIVGTPDNDVLVGTAGRDIIRGRGGNDTIIGRGGNDSLYGGRGYDTLTGGRGRDCLFGGPDADELSGDQDSHVNGGEDNSIDGVGGSDEGWYHESSQWSSVERGKY